MQDANKQEYGIVDRRLNGSELWLLSFAAGSTLLLLGWVLRYGNYGFEFTDEGYYAVWIRNPFLYDWSTTQFGFIYHPLYLMAGGNLSILRWINLIITFFLASCAFYTAIKESASHKSEVNWPIFIVSASFGVASLAYLNLWIATPSYNTLALQALLIMAIGFALSESVPTRSSLLGWTLIGVGAWLAFMAKPPTAVLLVPCFILYILLAGKIKFRLVLIPACTAAILLLLSALVIDGSLVGFVQRLRLAAEFSNLSGAGYSLHQLLRLDEFEFSDTEREFLAAMTAVAFIVAILTASTRPWLKACACLLTGALFGVICWQSWGSEQTVVRLGKFQGLMLWAPAFAGGLLALVALIGRYARRIPLRFVALALIFLVFPYIYAFGTNGNYWQAASSAAVFWILAGVIAARCATQGGGRWVGLIPLSLAAQVIVALLLQNGMERPYRQNQALRLHTSVVAVDPSGPPLIVSKEYGAYIDEVKVLAAQAGFTPRTPMIDLTGQSPGILYVLRAESLGYPWIAGGYPGSVAVARGSLGRVSCSQLGNAWLLTEPEGPRAIPTTVLEDWGGNLDGDYELVASWRTAAGAGDYKDQRLQQLYRPIRSDSSATQACTIARSDRKR